MVSTCFVPWNVSLILPTNYNREFFFNWHANILGHRIRTKQFFFYNFTIKKSFKNSKFIVAIFFALIISSTFYDQNKNTSLPSIWKQTLSLTFFRHSSIAASCFFFATASICLYFSLSFSLMLRHFSPARAGIF